MKAKTLTYPWLTSFVLSLLFVASTLGLQQQRLRNMQVSSITQSSKSALIRQDQRDLLRLSLLSEMPTFGFENLIANWTFLNFLQYFGDNDSRSQVGYRVSPEFFEVIVDKDPLFIHPYLYLSTSTSLFAGEPERSVDMMTRGLSAMTPQTPEGGYRVWRYMGLDQLLFLGDGVAAQQSFEMAAAWADQSSEPEAESIAQISRQTAAFLAENPVSKAAQISGWIQVASMAIDDETRLIAIERIEALGGTIIVSEQGRISVQYNVNE